MRLKDKVAVITGASSGMGKEIALLFAKEGATVIAVARRKERLEEIAKMASGEAGKIIAYTGDISLRETNEAMIDFAVKEYGKIDILVNNAGIMDEMTPIGELTDERWNSIQTVNLYGPMCACRKAVNEMIKNEDGGAIVNVASVGGLQGCRAGTAYTASKFAIVGMTKNIAFTYAQQKIRCNVICPGGVNTEVSINMKAPSKLGMSKAVSGAANTPRMGEPSEIATAVLFLASSDASLINGATLVADSGWTAY